jgi:hypothetical protein
LLTVALADIARAGDLPHSCVLNFNFNPAKDSESKMICTRASTMQRVALGVCDVLLCDVPQDKLDAA